MSSNCFVILMLALTAGQSGAIKIPSSPKTHTGWKLILQGPTGPWLGLKIIGLLCAGVALEPDLPLVRMAPRWLCYWNYYEGKSICTLKLYSWTHSQAACPNASTPYLSWPLPSSPSAPRSRSHKQLQEMFLLSPYISCHKNSWGRK